MNAEHSSVPLVQRSSKNKRGGACMLSHVQLFWDPWIVACQAPLPLGFSRQEFWSGLSFPPPGGLPDLGIDPASPALQVDSLPLRLLGSPEREGSKVFLTPFNTHTLNLFYSGAGRDLLSFKYLV